MPHSVDIGARADGNTHQLRLEYDYDLQAANSDGSTFVDDVAIGAVPISTGR